MGDKSGNQDIVVVGAGLGGLVSAALLAKAGYRVRVLERGNLPGGRARSRHQEGFVFNLGAHALYRGGPAMRVLAELGIRPRGRRIVGAGAYLLHADRLYRMPTGMWSLAGSELLPIAGRVSLARLILSLGERKAERVQGLSAQQWIERETNDARTRDVLSMFVRLFCYANAPDLLPAQAVVRQLARGIRNGVLYLHGGWQTMLDALVTCVQAAGVQVSLGTEAAQIECAGSEVRAVVTRDGQRFEARAVVAAVEPRVLSALLPGDAYAQRWAGASVPLRAACLDVGAYDLPYPERRNVQSIDAPLYFANHSAFADLAPAGGNVLHLVRYLAPGEDGRACEPELRALLERVQPGCLKRSQVQRFMPNLIVHGDVPGTERARGEHPELAGLFPVGDFASNRAMLTDAVIESARASVERIRERLPLTAASSAQLAGASANGHAGRAA